MNSRRCAGSWILSLEELTVRFGLSRATIEKRKAAGRLTPDESGKVVCYARLLGHAVHLFGGLEEARQWLKAPQGRLHGAVPLDYAKTDLGAREVENLLTELAYGIKVLRPGQSRQASSRGRPRCRGSDRRSVVAA